MIQLRDKETGTVLGVISQDDLNFLIDHLEEESETDTDYYINRSTLDFLKPRVPAKHCCPCWKTPSEVAMRWRLSGQPQNSPMHPTEKPLQLKKNALPYTIPFNGSVEACWD